MAAPQPRVEITIRWMLNHHKVAARLLQALTLSITALTLRWIIRFTFIQTFEYARYFHENLGVFLLLATWNFWKYAFAPLAIGLIVFWLIGKLADLYSTMDWNPSVARPVNPISLLEQVRAITPEQFEALRAAEPEAYAAIATIRELIALKPDAH